MADARDLPQKLQAFIPMETSNENFDHVPGFENNFSICYANVGFLFCAHTLKGHIGKSILPKNGTLSTSFLALVEQCRTKSNQLMDLTSLINCIDFFWNRTPKPIPFENAQEDHKRHPLLTDGGEKSHGDPSKFFLDLLDALQVESGLDEADFYKQIHINKKECFL